ncbi:MAG: hypothetical protein ACYCVH_01010 [Ignavibacteriaceae bacterium]
MKRFFRFSLFLFLLFGFVGCGASTYTTDRYEFSPYSPTESKQTKENITIERVDLKKMPAELTMVVQGCNASGQLLVNNLNQPYMVDEYIVPKNGLLEKLLITNNTNHVIRFNNTVMVAFDPAGNQYPIMSKDEIKAQLQQERPCPSTNQLINKLNTIKFFDRNTELLPNMTTAGFIYYMPQDMRIPGTWKLTIYDFPVETDASGVVKKTIAFDFRSVEKKFKDTYKKEFLGQPERISTEEVK